MAQQAAHAGAAGGKALGHRIDDDDLLSALGEISYTFVYLGIAAFSLSLVFQLITLPVEFNASSRAMAQMESLGLILEEEKHGAKKVLSAAAMTYVASLAMAIMNLIRILALRNRD